MDNVWSQIKYFKPEEFDSPDEPGSGHRMDMNFILKLDKLRETFGAPLVVNSGYRTEKHNTMVGGVLDSAHTKGRACDIKCSASADRFKLLHIAVNMGFKRIGLSKYFIHLDVDPDLPQNVVWFY